MSSDLDTLARLWTTKDLSPLNTMRPMNTERHDHQLVEVVVSPQSSFIGHADHGRIAMANLITNTASAVFLFPIALSIADQLGVNFMPFAIALMTGTVGASITPAAYQNNLMVYGPGDCAFMDFVKIGVPLIKLSIR